MISLLKYVVRNYLTSNADSSNENEETEAEVLAKIEQAIEDKEKEIERPPPQLNLIENEPGSFYKNGVVTLVKQDYVLIDHDYMCETKHIIPEDLKEGDKVHYVAYKKNANDQLKISKISFKIESTWDDQEDAAQVYVPQQTSTANHESVNGEFKLDPEIIEYKNNQIIEKKGIKNRDDIDQVGDRKGRKIYLNENQIWVDLDKVSLEFIPVIGDWVVLDGVFEIDQDVANLRGKILEVEAIKPYRPMQVIGKISEYDEIKKLGKILYDRKSDTVFVLDVCAPGYIPNVGDKVISYSLESNQRPNTSRRAVQVVPLEDAPNKFETASIKYKPQLPADEIEELIKDKENIEITKDIKVTVDAAAKEDVEVTVTNNGNSKQTMFKCYFVSNRSQVTLLSPTINDRLVLKPLETVTFRFRCKGKLVGVSEELVVFKFGRFKIGRMFVITVNSINSSSSEPSESSNVYTRNDNGRSIVPRPFEDGMYIRGEAPCKAPRFIPVRQGCWRIPERLWQIMNHIVQDGKKHSEAEAILTDGVPCLKQHLNVENYKTRFHHLLYLEEIAQILDMKRFNMANAVLYRNNEFLTLNVPGLAEKRPSLIVGDKVIVSFEWDDTGGQKCYEGCIHKIKNSDVFLKFNTAFHDSYHGEACQISFKGSTTVIQRCHYAVEHALNRLGADFLFPKRVFPKEPQFHFVEEDDDDADDVQNDDAQNMRKVQKIHADTSLSREERVAAINAILHYKKISWFTKHLNVYQKEAVRNILKGIARPLPYVIFGPPGTGKTVTVCESILQILATMSDSRILVATPSNSSANLIAERLLTSNVLEHGDMVRLVAHHYLESDQIPEKLIEYCVTADLAEEGTRPDNDIRHQRGFRTNVPLSKLIRSRIIVGTCSALGILHSMGCKQGHFTHVIVDEAGQATEPQIMIPLILAHTNSSQIILAGDPKQLGPVNQSRYAGYFGLNDSFLVRLLQLFPYLRDSDGFESGHYYDPRLVTKLLMNYRSLPELLDLPNKLFYEAELIPQVDENDSEEAELLQTFKEHLPKRLGNPSPIVFVAVNGKNEQEKDSPSWYNDAEITQVLIYLMDLYNCGLAAKDVGIITPYSKQVFRIRSILAKHDLEPPKVGSVEEFQGQERKVIILSTVRTAEDKVRDDIKHALGFVSARERLNVAITRARSLLIIIGSPKLLQKDVYWRSVLEYCISRNGYVGQSLISDS